MNLILNVIVFWIWRLLHFNRSISLVEIFTIVLIFLQEQPKSSVWDKLTFAQDQDGKMTAKFRKLMGIKSENAAKEPQDEDKESVLKKQEELFRDLDQQYEMARMTTHTQRGVGLGYSAQTLYPPVPK